MISLVEIADRMRNGPRMANREWDMALFKKISELTKEYNIKCPTEPTNWININTQQTVSI